MIHTIEIHFFHLTNFVLASAEQLCKEPRPLTAALIRLLCGEASGGRKRAAM